MPNRVGRFVESIVYAGLKSSGSPQEPKRGGWLRPLRDRIERFLAGGVAPSDPLYLTNRNWRQKVRLGLVIAVPCLVFLGLMALGFSLKPRKTAPARVPTSAEIAAQLLPNLEKTVKVELKDAELMEVRVVRGDAPRIAGKLKNNTGSAISVEFTLDLTNDAGSRVGAVTEQVEHAPSRATVPFDFPLASKDAAFALVREIRRTR